MHSVYHCPAPNKRLSPRFALVAGLLAVCVVGCGSKKSAGGDRNHGVSPLFARSFGDAEVDLAHGVAADAKGNVFVCGDTRPKKRALVDPPGQAFVLKYSARGDQLWSKYKKGWSSAVAVAADPAGNAFVTGRTNPTGGAMSSQKYLTKYDGDGGTLWSLRSGGEAMAVDKAGNAVVVGIADAAHGGVDLVLNRKLYVAKVTGAGEHAWVKTMLGESHAQRIAVDGAGDVFVAGTFEGTADLGGGIVSAAGNRDVFIVKRSGEDGRHLWSHTYRGDKDVQIAGLVATTGGSVVVVLEFHNRLTLGGKELVGSGDSDVAMAAFTGSGGIHLWSSRVGGSAADKVNSATAGRYGSFIIAGSCSGTCNFGDKSIAARDRGDAFIASFSGKGKLLSAEVFGAVNSLEEVTGVASLADGDFVATGTFNGDQTKIGSRALTSKGGVDVFVTKLDE